MAQIPAMLFASSGAGLSSHPAANASSSGFDAILAALTPHTQLPHLPAIASLNEYASLHDYSALPRPTFQNTVPAFPNIGASLPAPTIRVLKASVALPIMTAHMRMRDQSKQGQDTPKPAAPSRIAAPSPTTLNALPQPIRPTAAPAPASTSPVASIEASDDSADRKVRAAATPSPSSSLAPVTSKAEATGKPDHTQEPVADVSPISGTRASDTGTDHMVPSAAAPSRTSNPAPLTPKAEAKVEPHQETTDSLANLPPATQSETSRPISGGTTQHADIPATSNASAEVPRSAASNPAAQQATVRIAPGTALPQHVVEAIMAAKVDAGDPLPVTIPASVADKLSQPDMRPQTSNVKGVPSGLPADVAGLDRIVKTSPLANATSRVESFLASGVNLADPGSGQPVTQDASRTTPPSPTRAGDVSPRVLDTLVKTSGANITTTVEEIQVAPNEMEAGQARQPSATSVNTDASDTHREMQPALSRSVVTDQTAKQSPLRAADPGVTETNLRTQPTSIEPADQTAKESSSRPADSGVADANPRPQQNPASVDQIAEQPSTSSASPETGDTRSLVRNLSSTATADYAARQATAEASDPLVNDVLPETHQSPAVAAPRSGSADKPQSRTTDRELAPAQTQQKPVPPASADQIAKPQAAPVTDPESAPVQTQQKLVAPAPADQIAKPQVAPVTDPELAPVPTQQKSVVPAPADQVVKPQAVPVTDPESAPVQAQLKPVVPASADQDAKPQAAPVTDPESAPVQAQQKPVAPAPADHVAKLQAAPVTDLESASVQARQTPVVPAPADQVAKPRAAPVTNPESTPFQTQPKPVAPSSADQIAKPQVALVNHPESATDPAQQRPVVSASPDQVAKQPAAAVTDPEIAGQDVQPSNTNRAATSPATPVDNSEPADMDSPRTQEPASADRSVPAENADASRPQATTPVRPSPAAIEVIDPAEMLVSETAQPATAGDAPAQMRGPARKALDSSAVAPKTNGSSAAGAKPEQQPPATLATAASATKTAGDTGNDTLADNTTADDAAAQSQTDSASGKVDAAQPASSGPAVPVASSTSQPGGAAFVTGTAQAAVTPTVTTPAATTAASTSAASATAEPTPDIDSLAVAIATNAARGTKHFDIRLDPPELGRVDVHMSVSRDGKAEALLTADRPETLELLQRDSKTLERALKDAGLDLSNNSLNFSLKGQHRQGDGASMARMRSLSDAVVARAEAANASTPIWSHAPGSARLDIRV